MQTSRPCRIRYFILIAASAFFLISGRGAAISASVPTPDACLPRSFAALVERVRPAVVNISTTALIDAPANPLSGIPGGTELFEELFGPFARLPERKVRRKSLGSGFIIDPDGFIVTNNHVIEAAQEIVVKLSDGRDFPAKLVGRDAKTDLALLRIATPFHRLPVLPLGNSERVRVGDWIIAVGNPFGLDQSVTQGIVSATARVIGSGLYDEFLQTDAPINPGNSGGPLLNLDGEVVGISSSVVAGGEGIGFAIPSNLAKAVVPQLKEHGRIRRGWVGASIQAVTPALAREFALEKPEGALVADVAEGGPAEKAGLMRGDVIVSYAGRAVASFADLPRLGAETPVGSRVPVVVVRDGRRLAMAVTVAEMTERKSLPEAAQAREGVAFFGITVQEPGPALRERFSLGAEKGVLVTAVAPASAAAAAGILPGDFIVEIARKPVPTLESFTSVINASPDGRPFLLLIKRGGKGLYVTVQPTP